MKSNNYAELLKILGEMEHLLRRDQAYGHANDMERVIDQFKNCPDETIPVLLGKEFWGGSGSYFDLLLCPYNDNVSDDFERDNRQYRCLLLGLIKELRANGCSRPDFDWLEKYLQNLV